ncbi:hypothetical protein H8B13_09055 [Hymenobacter sp. BT188]|uniref:hypothetical protein n=1 Tax=Hymenobacter sp. BT188 TaxID=2763504 RepID=UPI0016518B62|nr:hypothetical protein [Hymenobacter sp. BT188]MBC6606964.1 hypothetical protein [Hymenobacter sp. BT188]
MKEPLVYYSTNTHLSHFISERYYGGIHFAWCSPVFDPSILGPYDIYKRIPVSSSPKYIYYLFIEDLKSQDFHSASIERNKNGLKNGALQKLKEKVINIDDFNVINEIINLSTIQDYKPLVYIIPATLIKDKLVKVSVDKQANPLSTEYVVSNLESNDFEIIEISKS